MSAGWYSVIEYWRTTGLPLPDGWQPYPPRTDTAIVLVTKVLDEVKS